MQEVGNNQIIKQKLTIRMSAEGMSFSVFNPSLNDSLVYEPYVNNSSISLAANLREAVKEVSILRNDYYRTTVALDSPTLIVPDERFNKNEAEILYMHAFPGSKNVNVIYNALPDINAVAVFCINKDVKLVLDDNFSNLRYTTVVTPVWHHLHERSFAGVHQKLYGYFHDKKLDIFCFNQNRFKFCNSFEAQHTKDAIYFILFVWKQLTLDIEKDELHLSGDIPERDWLLQQLRQYLRNAFTVNPKADYNRSPVTNIADMPYDLQTLLICGR